MNNYTLGNATGVSRRVLTWQPPRSRATTKSGIHMQSAGHSLLTGCKAAPLATPHRLRSADRPIASCRHARLVPARTAATSAVRPMWAGPIRHARRLLSAQITERAQHVVGPKNGLRHRRRSQTSGIICASEQGQTEPQGKTQSDSQQVQEMQPDRTLDLPRQTASHADTGTAAFKHDTASVSPSLTIEHHEL